MLFIVPTFILYVVMHTSIYSFLPPPKILVNLFEIIIPDLLCTGALPRWAQQLGLGQAKASMWISHVGNGTPTVGPSATAFLGAVAQGT